MSQITLENREAGEAEVEEVSVGETRAPLFFCHCHFPRCGDKDSLAGYDEEEEVGVSGKGRHSVGLDLEFLRRQASERCAVATKLVRRAKINSRGRINSQWMSRGLSNSYSSSVMDSLDLHSLFVTRRWSSNQTNHAEHKTI